MIRDRAHLDFVRQLPCLATGRAPPCDPAHIRVGGDGGTGLKPSDNRVVPLNHAEHLHQHDGERSYWNILRRMGISDPEAVAAALYKNTGDLGAGYRIIRNARPGLRTAVLPPI